MVMARHSDGHDSIDIFEVGSALIKIRSFFPPLTEAKIGSFSPTTYRISISVDGALYIFNFRNSECLLYRMGYFISHCFSSDGSIFAASQESGLHIWKYTSDGYTLWREFRYQGWSNSPLRFSPTLSSILGHSRNILQVLRLHELPAVPKTRHQQYVGLSRSGTRVVIAHEMESTVTIIDILAQTPPQLIYTDLGIKGLVVTGNILLVAGLKHLVAWLLTEEGLVDGVFGNRRIDRGGSIWTIPLSQSWIRLVEGQVGVIKSDGNALHIYNTETGEVLRPTQALLRGGGRWYHLGDMLRGRDYLHYHNLPQSNIPPEDSWQTSRATLREG